MSQPTAHPSADAKLRAAIQTEKPLQVVGAINAYAARMAEATGFRALYLSGGGVAANSLGLPDLGISTMDDVLIDIRRITDACTLPLLVDADTGWGGAFNIARTVRSFIKAGAADYLIKDVQGEFLTLLKADILNILDFQKDFDGAAMAEEVAANLPHLEEFGDG